MITHGNWQAKGSAIITNIPPARPGYTWEDLESEHRYYGGYIVAESIMSKDDASLIAAAPELLNALELLLTRIEDALCDPECKVHLSIPFRSYVTAKKAFLKANPNWEFPNRHYIIHEIHKPPAMLMITGGIPDTQHHSYYARR